jgi:hypothetical protein
MLQATGASGIMVAARQFIYRLNAVSRQAGRPHLSSWR